MSNEVLELLNLLSNTQKSKPNAADISTYDEAVKYIAKYLSNDEYFLDRIRHMIKEQGRREAEWMRERNELISQQQLKLANRKELERVLRLVGGAAGEPEQVEEKSPELTNDLLAFDLRVHSSFEQLLRSQNEILAELHVPLFCTSRPVNSQDQMRVAEFLRQLAK